MEAPSFHIPTVNIGDRQKGRMRGKSVIDCGCTPGEIEDAIRKAQSMRENNELQQEPNPYEGDNTSETILRVIREYLASGGDLKKRFYDIDVQC